MKSVLKLVQAEAKRLAAHPLFTEWLANPSISARGKLSFCPAAIDFVMGFRDLNLYYVRYPEPQDALERTLNEHAAEDATHASLFLQDWEILGVDAQLGWTPRELYWFITSDDTLEARRLDFELASMVHRNRDPRMRFAIIESMEAAGNVFFRATVPIAAELQRQGLRELPYFGEYHLARETGHLQAGGEKLFFAEALSDADRGKANALVLRTFAIFHAHFRAWERYARRVVSGERPASPAQAGRAAAAAVRATPAVDVTQALSMAHPMHPTGYGAELTEHLHAAYDRLWRMPFYSWIRTGPHRGFAPMVRSFLLQWVVDNWTCADWFVLDTPYPRPTTPLERGINRLSTLYAAEMNRRFVEWETLDFDARTGWTPRDALAHYWLDPDVEDHRAVFADLRKLTLDHPSPVARYWILKGFVRFGDALMHSLGHAMAVNGVPADDFVGFAGHPERLHPDLPPDVEADRAVLALETQPVSRADAAQIHAILDATCAQEARRAAITWRVLQAGRYAHLDGAPIPVRATTMADFSVEHSLPAPAGDVWDVLGDFGGAVRWGAPEMEACRTEGTGVGAVRFLTGRGGLALSERLQSYDPARRRLSYRILEPHPLPFSDYELTLEVLDDGGGSRVRWSARYEPKAPPDVVTGLLAQVYAQNVAGVCRALGVDAAAK